MAAAAVVEQVVKEIEMVQMVREDSNSILLDRQSLGEILPGSQVLAEVRLVRLVLAAKFFWIILR